MVLQKDDANTMDRTYEKRDIALMNMEAKRHNQNENETVENFIYMWKEGLENLKPTEYPEGKRNRGKAQVTYLMNSCKWMTEQVEGSIVKIVEIW